MVIKTESFGLMLLVPSPIHRKTNLHFVLGELSRGCRAVIRKQAVTSCIREKSRRQSCGARNWRHSADVG